jgi:hypothetical protein
VAVWIYIHPQLEKANTGVVCGSITIDGVYLKTQYACLWNIPAAKNHICVQSRIRAALKP